MSKSKKEYATARVKNQILQLRVHIQKLKIEQKEIAEKTGLTQPSVCRFFKPNAPQPSLITFILICEATGFKTTIF